MQSFSVYQEVPASTDVVFSLLWAPESLRLAWMGIIECKALYDDGSHQDMLMRVSRNNLEEKIRIVRFRDGHNIYFFNPQPPPMMRMHRGAWLLTGEGQGKCLLEATREYDLRTQAFKDNGALMFHQQFQERVRTMLSSFVRAVCKGQSNKAPKEAG